MVKARFRSSCVWAKTKKYSAAKLCGLSVNTYSKYFNECIELGLIRTDRQGNYHFPSYRELCRYAFGEKGAFIRVDRAGTLQGYKEAIRAAIALNSFKSQDFYTIGDSLFESGTKAKGLRQAKALSWVKNRAPHRAYGIKKVRTSSRSVARLIGMSHVTGNKALRTLLRQKKVVYEYEQSFFRIAGNTASKVAFAETNKPFPSCTYSILNGGVKFHIGRIVNFK